MDYWTHVNEIAETDPSVLDTQELVHRQPGRDDCRPVDERPARAARVTDFRVGDVVWADVDCDGRQVQATVVGIEGGRLRVRTGAHEAMCMAHRAERRTVV